MTQGDIRHFAQKQGTCHGHLWKGKDGAPKLYSYVGWGTWVIRFQTMLTHMDNTRITDFDHTPIMPTQYLCFESLAGQFVVEACTCAIAEIRLFQK